MRDYHAKTAFVREAAAPQEGKRATRSGVWEPLAPPVVASSPPKAPGPAGGVSDNVTGGRER